MENMIAVLVIVILVGSAAAYLIKAKRKRSEMCWMSSGRKLQQQKLKTKKNEIDGSGHRKENPCLLQECIVNIVYKV